MKKIIPPSFSTSNSKTFLVLQILSKPLLKSAFLEFKVGFPYFEKEFSSRFPYSEMEIPNNFRFPGLEMGFPVF